VEGTKEFREGDLVVYPNHGAGTVTGVEEKTVLGEERRYYVVHLPESELTASVPAASETGLRPCSDEASVAGALDSLGDAPTKMPSNWNHRLKHNREKLREGGILEVAEVVRNLHLYGAEHGLSTGERSLLIKARQILSSEVALSRGIALPEADGLVAEALKNGRGGKAPNNTEEDGAR
jgi:CarD family transcriptional regulator